MGVIAEGILRGCQGLLTPVPLGYPLSVFNKNSTLKPMSSTWFAKGGLGPLTWPVFSIGFFVLTSFPPPVTAVSITHKGSESPSSDCIGVMGALVYFFPSEAVGARGGGRF